MITKEKCRTLKVGDYLLISNKWRQVLKIGMHPRGNIIYFSFKKIRGEGHTLYTNYDIKYKTNGLIRFKKLRE